MSIGERPIGAAKGKQPNTEPLCPPPPPPGPAGVHSLIPRGLPSVGRCDTEDTSFHGIVTEYADGGELCNYLQLGADVDHEHMGLEGNCSFTEEQARFLFRQIVDLLNALHHPPAGADAYFHGDLKDANLVIDGCTLKLIDYGSLSKVEDEEGPSRHNTPAYQQVLQSAGGMGREVLGGVPCAVRALCKKLAVLHHREFGKFRRLKGRH